MCDGALEQEGPAGRRYAAPDRDHDSAHVILPELVKEATQTNVPDWTDAWAMSFRDKKSLYGMSRVAVGGKGDCVGGDEGGLMTMRGSTRMCRSPRLVDLGP